MIITDKIAVENGIDFSFVCRKIPFAITCSTDFLGYGSNLIDMDLVNKMQIPIRNIKVKRMQILGQNVRSVGIVKQSIQCVINGKSVGTVHITAKVIRDLFSIFNVDCVASDNTYTKLTGKDPPSNNDDLGEEDDHAVNNIPNLGDDNADVEEEMEETPEKEEISSVENSNLVPGDYDSSHHLCKHRIYGCKDCAELKRMWDERDNRDFDNNDAHHDDNSPPFQILKKMVPCTSPLPYDQQPKLKKTQDDVCNLCYMENLPPEIFLSHPTLHPRCPSLSDADKKRLYGHKWRTMI